MSSEDGRQCLDHYLISCISQSPPDSARLTKQQDTTSRTQTQDLGCETSIPGANTFLSGDLDEGGVCPDLSAVLHWFTFWRKTNHSPEPLSCTRVFTTSTVLSDNPFIKTVA